LTLVLFTQAVAQPSPAAAKSTSGDWLRWDETNLAEVLPRPVHGEKTVESNSLRLILDPPELRPQDRWFQLRVELDGPLPDGAEIVVEARDALDRGKVLQSIPVRAERARVGRLDLRSPGWAHAVIEVTLLINGNAVDRAVAFIPCNGPETPLAAGQKIPLRADFPKGTAPERWPVRFGIPFAPGQLWDAGRISLQDGGGEPVPAQFTVAGRWAAEGSIRWLLVESAVSPEQLLSAVVDNPGRKESPAEVRIVEEKDFLKVNTGVAEFVLSKNGEPLREISVDGKVCATTAGTRGLFITDQKKRTGQPAGDLDWRIEQAGRLSASVRFEGDYTTDNGVRLARFILRLDFSAGKPFVEVTHTLVLTEKTDSLWFGEIGWEFAVPESADGLASIPADGEDPPIREVKLASGREIVNAQLSIKGLSGMDDRFETVQTEGTARRQLATGHRMGDWFALRSDSGTGLFASIRDCALQAPKAFRAGDGKLTIELFSARGGRELDFRMPALLARWNLASWKPLDKKTLASIAGYTSDAAGWAKTHQGLLSPITKANPPAQLASWSAMDTGSVYVHVDPAWILASGAMGPIHPQDLQHFPESEAFLAKIMDRYPAAVPGTFYTGFVDYYAGPHYGFSGRYRQTYTLLRGAWLNYARTGDRALRRFAEGASRAFRDNYIAHWDAGSKKQGLFVGCSGGGGEEGELKSDLPMYWERKAVFNMTTSADLNTLIWDYQLAGDRRSKDVVEEVGRAFRKHWTPQKDDWRIFMTLRMLQQLYDFTGEHQFRTMLEAGTAAGAYDPEGALLLTSKRPYKSSTYKTNTDVGNMIDIYGSLGTARWKEMAARTSWFWFLQLLGKSPLGRISGEYLLFLRKMDPSLSAPIAQLLDYNLRLSVGQGGAVGFSTLDSVLQGLPYAMSAVAEAEIRKQPGASLLEFDDYGNPSRIFVKKTDGHPIRLWVNSPRPGDDTTLLAPPVQIAAWNHDSKMGMDVLQLTANSGPEGAVEILIPGDAAVGTYAITTSGYGPHFVLADSSRPLAFAPGKYWRPSTFSPPYRYYFSAPKDGDQPPRIFFEGTAHLFLPDGSRFQEGKPLTGWIDLPRDIPGLWSFEPLRTGLISSAGIAATFAMNDPKAWFDPGVGEDVGVGTEEGEGTPYSATDPKEIRGTAISKPDGLRLPIAESSRLINSPSGEPPVAETGTVEFFVKPRWGTFDLASGSAPGIRPLMEIETDRNPWSLVYRLDPEGSTAPRGPKEPSHSFLAGIPLAKPANAGGRPSVLTPWATRKIADPNRWIHVALVWGRKTKSGVKGIVSVPYASLYINGRGTTHAVIETRQDEVVAGIPRAVHFLKDIDGEVAWLRVSSSARYGRDFATPKVSAGLPDDANTVLLAPLLVPND